MASSATTSATASARTCTTTPKYPPTARHLGRALADGWGVRVPGGAGPPLAAWGELPPGEAGALAGPYTVQGAPGPLRVSGQAEKRQPAPARSSDFAAKAGKVGNRVRVELTNRS